MFSKLKHYSSNPYLIIGSGLTIVTLFTALSGVWHYHYELRNNKIPAKTAQGQPLQKPGASETKVAQTEPNLATATNPGSSNSSPASVSKNQSNSKPGNTQSTSSSVATTSAPAAPTQPINLQISLSVNGSFQGTVVLSPGSNNCDVLSGALAQGVISSLDMRYSSQYKTMAVYVINGIGDPGSIWWTYKVNGSAPPYGCGNMAAHNGDSVNWQYVKN